MAGYLAAIEKDKSNNDSNTFRRAPSNYLMNSFGNLADSLEEDGYDHYEVTPCAGFWVRRSIDGTEDEFYNLLRLILKNFDKHFEF